MKSFYDRIGISISKCGLCCEEEYPCDSCIERTLNSNGLSLELKNVLKGLSQRDTAHAWNEYSPFNEKLKELIKNQRKLEI